jgi:hypothetical protein
MKLSEQNESKLTDKIKKSERLKELYENYKKLVNAKMIELEKENRFLKFTDNTNTKVSNFFDKQEHHIFCIQKQTHNTSVPLNLRRILITQVLNYVEEYMITQ